MDNLYGINKVQKLKEKFFDYDSYYKIIKENNGEVPYGVIYKIENLNNGKTYIGQTTNINQRVMNYISEFNNKDRKVYDRCSISKYMRIEDISNFKMSVIDYANSRDSLDKLEIDYIIKYNNCNPELGYNESLSPRKLKITDKIRQRLSQIHTGMKMSNGCKRRKSKPVILFDFETKWVIFCDSGKLAGDYLNIGKDLVKNHLHRVSLFKKRRYLLLHFDKEERGKYIGLFKERYDNAHPHSGYELRYDEKYNTVVNFSNAIDKMFEDKSFSVFNNLLGYTPYRLEYSDDKEKPYLFYEIDSFEEMHKSLIS